MPVFTAKRDRIDSTPNAERQGTQLTRPLNIGIGGSEYLCIESSLAVSEVTWCVGTVDMDLVSFEIGVVIEVSFQLVIRS